MKFDVLNSVVHFSKVNEHAGSNTISFDVVPTDGACIEIGSEHVLSSQRSFWRNGKDRKPVIAQLSISTNSEGAWEERDGTKHVGRATFYPERVDLLDGTPPKVYFVVILDQSQFTQLLDITPVEAGSVTAWVSIDGLEFGWEPDGSRGIWTLDGSDASRVRKISNFSLSAETFWTGESAIQEVADRKLRVTLANSSDKGERELGKQITPEPVPDPMMILLRQCRLLLILLLLASLAELLVRVR